MLSKEEQLQFLLHTAQEMIDDMVGTAIVLAVDQSNVVNVRVITNLLQVTKKDFDNASNFLGDVRDVLENWRDQM